MREIIADKIKCDFCNKDITNFSKGEMELTGSTSGTSSACTSVRYNDICYSCTKKLFSFIFKNMLK